ncbi:MAG: biotin synthase BioB [Nitrospiraceae bacterium]|nr:MAG: biotin synthase BioB [Nitrospiraceae bacterium]
MLKIIESKVFDNGKLTRKEALFISSLSGQDLFDLFSSANRIRNHFRGDAVDLCAIINAKSGFCPEDCSYCAQSAGSTAEIKTFQLVGKETVLEKALEAKKGGARRFCIVTSGKKASAKDLSKIAEMVSAVRKLGLLPCATLGLLSKDELQQLKEAGLERYHNNIETSERFFSEICTTHTYQDKIATIKEVKSCGLSLCSGGIFGLGETWEDRIDMAFALRDISPDSVPINFLTPVKGTRLGVNKFLEPFEALKIISLYRFMLPDKEIRVCGGRIQTLGEFNSFIFYAGADGLLTGDYLTTLGRNYKDDLQLISQHGLKVL